MDRELFDQYASHSDVPEPVKAQQAIPDDLLNEESIFIATLPVCHVVVWSGNSCLRNSGRGTGHVAEGVI